MADEENEKTQEEPTKQEGQKAPGGGKLIWIITAVVVLLCAGSGFMIGRIFAGSGDAQADPNQTAPTTDTTPDEADPESLTTWFYRDMPPVVSNLDVPGVTRYVRAAVILEVSSAISEKKGLALFAEKAPILTNWLTIYLASLSIEDIRGDKNLRRIQSHILDAFNEQLFPDEKPKIKHVLFKEFAIQ